MDMKWVIILLCTVPGSWLLTSGEDLFREGGMECQGQVATHTSECVIIPLSFCLANQPSLLQVRDRPEIVNIKFSFAGSEPVQPDWPDKGSRHFLRDKIHLSWELSTTSKAGPSTKPLAWASGPSHWTLLGAVESLVSCSNGAFSSFIHCYKSHNRKSLTSWLMWTNNEKTPKSQWLLNRNLRWLHICVCVVVVLVKGND